MAHPVDGLPLDVDFDGIDPTKWRDMEDPDSEFDNDEDEPTPPHVIAILGFDPDELFSEEEE